MNMDDWNYYNDYRVRAAERGSWYSSFDENTMTATVEMSLSLTEEQRIQLGLPSPLMDLAAGQAYKFGCQMTSEGEFEERESGLAASSDTVAQIIAAAEAILAGYTDITYWDYDDVEVQVRCAYETCPTCGGKGKHVNPNIDAGGISGDSDFWDDDIDYDGGEGGTSRYMRGDYDVSCYECHGLRVVPFASSDNPDYILKALDERARDQASYEAERAAERRMGC